jgi:IstB-like ATP binding protein
VRDERRLDEKLLALSKLQLLIIDEIGYLPLEPDGAPLFQLLASATNLHDADRSASRTTRNSVPRLSPRLTTCHHEIEPAQDRSPRRHAHFLGIKS